jgi:predicted dienelactone hydrolase
MRLHALVPLMVALSAPAVGQPAQRPAPPERPFVKPDGPWAVGSIDTLWVDSSRDEVVSKDPTDKRRVLVQIWYPTEATPGSVVPYIRRPEEFGSFAGFRPLGHVRTNAIDGAPLAPTGGRFPVLMYHHGGLMMRFSGTFTTEWLASHGYVVVSVEHNGFNRSVSFTDGYRLVHDTLVMPPVPNQDRKAETYRLWEYYDRQLFPMWIADAGFVLDQIERLAVQPGGRFRGRLDLDRVGMLGWSFGGAAAVDMAIRDPRVKAAVDQDGQLFGLARSTGSARPVLLLHNDADPMATIPEDQRASLQEVVDLVHRWDSTFRARSTGPVYDVTIANTTHIHFSDLTLLYPGDTTHLAPRRAHEIINDYTLQFFDQHLRGRPASLLTGPSPRHPEVTFFRAGRP